MKILICIGKQTRYVKMYSDSSMTTHIKVLLMEPITCDLVIAFLQSLHGFYVSLSNKKVVKKHSPVIKIVI